MTADLSALIARLEAADIDQAFWSRCDRSGGPDACWPWGGYRNDRGYGVLRPAKKRAVRAHRLAYAIAYGGVDADKLVCHSCDNPSCCNPRHLWLGSYADNNRDRQSKGRSKSTFGSNYSGPRPVRERHGSAKLTESAVNEIRSSDLSGAALARKFGVHEGTISRVRLGQTWTANPLPPKKSTLRAKQGEKT